MMGAPHPALSSQERAPTLQPARHPDRPFAETRVLTHDMGARRLVSVEQLGQLLRPGDLLVLNDAGTLPASLIGRVRGAFVELRLAGTSRQAGFASFPSRWRAVAFGPGTWRDDTDHRPPPPPLHPGDRIELGAGFAARVLRVRSRLVEVDFGCEGDALARRLYAAARPVQYRHLRRALRISEVQTGYAGRPWSVEMPSTGRPLRLSLLGALRAEGVQTAWLTHAAGLSATGLASLDAALPLDERYDIPEATLAAVDRTRAVGGRVVAVGTTVVRALEAFGITGQARGWATRRIEPTTPLRVADALLTGVHSPGESHWELLGAFMPGAQLSALHADAVRSGLLAHEFGDLLLVRRQGS